ncbi:DNA translocase FtsK 4TM domain-containing protein, partial [Actinotalea sp.]|uniref:DNA translocase FtsK 4TM domain-containing protein n=1 Tax=Actinotalea sp. TaxID=1872145 RepID=UPI00356786B8
MATRTPSRGSTSSRAASGRPASAGKNAGRSSRTSSSGGPSVPAQRSLPVRMVRGTWMGAAHVVGGAGRRIGRGARDLDPAHRRDGAAFAVLALAFVIASREWWGLSGSAGDVIHDVVAGTFGAIGVVVPLLLLAIAVRLMRHPDRVDANGRMGVGLSAVLVSACGIAHVSAGAPMLDLELLRPAGGVIGYLVGAPLTSLLTVWVAVPILVLLGFFGVLVLTATPVHMIVPRLRAGYRRLTGADRVPAEEESLATMPTLAEQQVEHRGLRRLGRKRSGAPSSLDDATTVLPVSGDEAFEVAAITEPAVPPDADPDEPVEQEEQGAVATTVLTTGAGEALRAPTPTGVPRGEQPMLDG